MLLVEAGEALLRSAVVAGFDLWVVQDPGRPIPGTVRPGRVFLAGPAAVPDGTLHGLLGGLVQRYGIGQVLCGPGAPDAVRKVVRRVRQERAAALWRDPATGRLSDPLALRRLLHGGTQAPVAAEETGTVDEVRAAAERMGPPVLITSAGAPGDGAETAFVTDAEGLAAWAKTAVDGPHLIEELPAGPRFRVETLSLGGMHHVVSVERQERFAGGEWPTPDTLPRIRSCVRELLDLAGFVSGALRTDVVLTRQGPRITGCADGGL